VRPSLHPLLHALDELVLTPFVVRAGWNYFAQWAVVLPLEITAAGITVQYWEGAQQVPIAAWITIVRPARCIPRRVERS